MPSILATAPFTQATLTYEAPGLTPGPPDEYGNPTWPPITGTLSAFVTPDRAKQLQLLPGADAVMIPVKVELVDPLTLPANVGLGSTLSLTWEGAAMVITITSVTPNDLVGVDFGTFLLGEMRSA